MTDHKLRIFGRRQRPILCPAGVDHVRGWQTRVYDSVLSRGFRLTIT
jgi:hypothetical protein